MGFCALVGQSGQRKVPYPNPGLGAVLPDASELAGRSNLLKQHELMTSSQWLCRTKYLSRLRALVC